MKSYMLDDASTLMYQRLDLMSRILDLWTREYLGALGVGQGWRCLDPGGGNGSIAEWLSNTVGPSGSIVLPAIFAEVRDRVLGSGRHDAATPPRGC